MIKSQQNNGNMTRRSHMNRLYRVDDIDRNLRVARFRPLDVLVIGGTGAGKSSTLNSLFGDERAKVGRGCDPETMDITSMELNELLRFWDSPGLGDNIEKDQRYAKELVDLLYETYSLDNQIYGWIDTVLVVLDGSARDMGTTYKILNEIVAPNFQVDRILVAINQADMAMKGRHWDQDRNCPDPVLKKFLDDKAESVQNRLLEATNIKVAKPVYYSAEQGYHIEELLDMIIDHMPKERRVLERF